MKVKGLVLAAAAAAVFTAGCSTSGPLLTGPGGALQGKYQPMNDCSGKMAQNSCNGKMQNSCKAMNSCKAKKAKKAKKAVKAKNSCKANQCKSSSSKDSTKQSSY